MKDDESENYMDMDDDDERVTDVNMKDVKAYVNV